MVSFWPELNGEKKSQIKFYIFEIFNRPVNKLDFKSLLSPNYKSYEKIKSISVQRI